MSRQRPFAQASGSHSLVARVSGALAWRQREAAYALRSMGAKCQIMAAKFYSRRPHRLPALLVVSVTSYRARFATLSLTLKCLLRQSIQADYTILWVTEEDYPHLPASVLALREEGLLIKTAPNTRSYKKILPAVALHPHAYICTADDDLFYWRTWLEELVLAAEPDSKVVPCHRTHQITLNESGLPNPYRLWVLDNTQLGHQELLFPTSGAGVLYTPGILQHSSEDATNALRYCATADDVWLFWICRRNGARFKMIGAGRELLAWKGSQEEALWYENMQKGGNDRQVAQMCSLYGFPPLRKAPDHAEESEITFGT